MSPNKKIEDTNKTVIKLEDEKFHYDLFQSQYESVTHSGFWPDSTEFELEGEW